MLADMEFEEDVLQEDSFQDGQPVQPGEAERRSRGPRTLEDVRNLVGNEVTVGDKHQMKILVLGSLDT